MSEKMFELEVITKDRLRTTIQYASERLVFCAPGVDHDIAADLAGAVSRLPGNSVYIHIDSSVRSLRTGYGTEAGIEILAELRKARIAETWRLGLLIADEEAFVYAPAPESIEKPPCENHEANGVILHGGIVDYFAESIMGHASRPLLEPKKDAAAKSENSYEQTAQLFKSSRIPEPKMARMMNMVRRLFKLVKFNHSMNLADKKVRLTAKDFGFQTQDIDPQLSITFQVVTEKHRKEIKKILDRVDREVKKYIKTGIIKSIQPYGYVVWYAEPEKLIENFEKVKADIESQIKAWLDKNYESVSRTSKELVQKFLNDDLFDRVNPSPGISHYGLSKEEFRNRWVEEQSERFALPTADAVLKTLKISCIWSDISQEMLENEEFRARLEEAFEIKLEELLDREERRI